MFGQWNDRSPLQRVEFDAAVIGLVAVLAGVIVGLVFLLPGLTSSSSSSGAAGAVNHNGHVAPASVSVQAKPRELDVMVGDYWFKPSSTRIRAGRVKFVAQNHGVISHDVMIERAPIKFESPGTPMDSAASGGVDELSPGMTKTTTVTLTPGRWVLFCSLPGHYVAGQRAVLTVTGPMPRGVTAPKPASGGMSSTS